MGAKLIQMKDPDSKVTRFPTEGGADRGDPDPSLPDPSVPDVGNPNGGAPKPEWRTVGSGEAADTLADPAKRRYLEPFLRRAHTLQQAADALGVNASTMHYQVRRLLRLELIEVVRVQARRGMASKVYRASARRFFVPLDRTSAATIEELLFDLEVDTLRTLVARSVAVQAAGRGSWGLGFALADDGKLEIDLLPRGSDADAVARRRLDARAPAFVNDYLTLRLSRADAKRLQRDLAALGERFRALEDAGGTPHLVHLALVPLEN